MKICPAGADLFHVEMERQTDKPKLTTAPHNFMNVPKKRSPCPQHEGTEREQRDIIAL
jgi:hypothetical protein